MSNLSRNIARLLDKKRMTQHDLAREAGINQAMVSRVMTGKTDLVADSLLQIADALGTTPAELLTEYPNVELSSLGTKRLPVWDYVQAGLWAGVSPNLRGEEMQDYVLTDGEYSDAAFALVIKGDSMEPDFKEGEVVIIDPSISWQPGDFVVAKDAKGEATFKKYRPRGLNDQGKEYFLLEPLNKDYEPMRSDLQQIQILGTMVEHRKYRRR